MGAFTTNCPRCSAPNEVDTDILPRSATVISCWQCATQINLSTEAVNEALKVPSIAETERQEQKAARAAAAGRESGASRGTSAGSRGFGIAVKVVAIGGSALLLGAFVLLVVLLFSSSGGTTFSSGQFRATYNSGDKRPEGTKAWAAKIKEASDFAPARKGDTVYVVAYDPPSAEAKRFAPSGVPNEILSKLRDVHAKLLTEGYAIELGPQTTALQEDQNERFNAKLMKGTCYQVVAIGGSKALDVDLLLYQPDGVRLIIADTLGAQTATLDFCPEKTSTYVYELRMRQGKGLVSHSVYRQLDTPFHRKATLYAFGLRDGQKRWEVNFDDEISSSPAVADQFLAFGTRTRKRSTVTKQIVEGGSLVVTSPNDGSTLCTYDAVGPVLSSPIIMDGYAYFGSCGESRAANKNLDVCDPASQVASKLYSLNLEDCRVLWSVDADHPIVDAPAADQDSVYFVAGEKVIAIDRLAGTQSWVVDTHGATSGPVTDSGLVVIGAHDGSVRGLDATSGDLRWVFEADASVLSTPAFVENVVYAASTDGNLYAIDATSGEKDWDMTVGSPVFAPISVAAGIVFVSAGAQLSAVDCDQVTRLFSIPLPGGAGHETAPILVDGTLVATDSGGNVFGIR